ncbi:MAG: ArsR/SmtB family transcription factor [Bdellovibrionales bacterium]
MKDFDSVFQAIGHRTRREILIYLHKKERPLTSSEILARISCSWPTLCQHLRKLERSGVMTQRKVGREVHYSLRKQRLVGVVKTWICAFDD